MKNLIKRGLLLGVGLCWATACVPTAKTAQHSDGAQLLQVKALRKKTATGGEEKIDSNWKAYPTRTIAHLPGYKPPTDPVALSKYGGRTDKREKATGFFYVTKKDGRWWAVDPLGYLYINSAVNSITMGGSERNKAALVRKFGDRQGWLEATKEVLRRHGFNGSGSWSDTQAILDSPTQGEKPLAYTVNWNFMSSYGDKRGGTYQKPGHKGYPNDAIFVFDPDFETFCDQHARQLIQYRDDPNLFGHFSDNEMPFLKKSLDNFLSLPKTDHGYLAAKEWLENKGIREDNITDAHRDEFLAYIGDRYFSIVSQAIRKYDPNHMYLGSRFHAGEKHNAAFMQAVGKYLDAVAINYYRVWTPDPLHMQQWETWTGKPFLITEYYAKGEDAGLPNTSGAGWIVKTQKERGLFYQNFNLALLESGNCVGWHYFKYQDNDPTLAGAEPSNIDANKGIVDNEYDLYTPMLALMKELNTQVYSLIDYFDRKPGL